MSSQPTVGALNFSNIQNQPPESLSARAPPTPHAKSGRRLSKSVMRADSQDVDGSKGWGMLSVRDSEGAERQVRVVQKAESEGMNMMKITWVFDIEGVMHQIELRHGRKSGIRKLYIDKQIVDRVKNWKDMVSDSGSIHELEIAGKQAEVSIVPKGLTGYIYQLKLDGNCIEQNMMSPDAQGPLDIGTRAVQLPKSSNGLGMTLRNNPLGENGVVVWTVEEGKAAEAQGVKVGDVVLSVEHHLVHSIDNLVAHVAEAVEVVHMELAGTATSREVALVKKHRSEDPDRPIGLGLQTTSCGIGILVTEIDPGTIAAESSLNVGDSILSIDGVVPVSPKNAVQLLLHSPYICKLIVIGNLGA